MEDDEQLVGLCVRMWASTREEVAIIYAEPSKGDLLQLIRDRHLLELLQVVNRTAVRNSLKSHKYTYHLELVLWSFGSGSYP